MVLTRGAGLLAALVPSAAMAAEEGVPLPHGWIGTTSDWVQGLGIALVALNLVILVVAWRALRKVGVTPATRGLLLVGLALVPGMVAFSRSPTASRTPPPSPRAAPAT